MILNDMLAYKVAMLSGTLSDSLYKVYEPYNLTMPEWRILATLAEMIELISSSDRETQLTMLDEKNALSAKQIAHATRLDKVKVSRALQSMEAKKLIERRPNKNDGRLINIYPTAHGISIYRTIVPLIEEWQKDVLSNITDIEYKAFLKVIDVLMV